MQTFDNHVYFAVFLRYHQTVAKTASFHNQIYSLSNENVCEEFSTQYAWEKHEIDTG